MPAKSKAQRNLMAAAEHGATFPAAKAIRQSMTYEQMHDFAATSAKTLPTSVKPASGSPAHVRGDHPHRNLGKYLHDRKK